MKYLVFTIIVMIGSLRLNAQNIAINTTGTDPDGSALLDIQGTNHGVLVPRVSLTATNAAGPVTSPAVSLLVYNTATVSDVTPGYYYWNGTAWVRFFDTAVNSADHDWYEVGTTDAPNSINDDIFTQGNVGVGTTSPVSKLDVVGTITIKENVNSYHQITPSLGGILTIEQNSLPANHGVDPNTQGIKFRTGAPGGSATQERMFINGSGNVGIGTTAPSEKLNIQDGVLRIDGTTFSSSGLTQGYLTIDKVGQYGDELGILIRMDGDGDSNGDGVFNGSEDIAIELQSDAVGVSANATTKYRLWTDGSVYQAGDLGIGTTTPSEKLEVDGNIMLRAYGTAGSGIFFRPGFGSSDPQPDNLSITTFDQNGAGTNDALSINANDGIRFRTNSGISSIDAINITRLGNVGIGTTTPNAKLDVITDATIGIPGVEFVNSAGVNTHFPHTDGQVYITSDYRTGVSGSGDINFRTVLDGISFRYLMNIKGDGNVGIGTINPLSKFSIIAASDNQTNESAFHGLTIKTGKTGQTMMLGYDSIADISYINSAKNGSYQPLILQSRGGNVGIGTTTPTATLSVEGTNGVTFRSTANTPELFIETVSTSSNTEMYLRNLHDNENYIVFSNGTDGSTVDGSWFMQATSSTPGNQLRFWHNFSGPNQIVMTLDNATNFVGIGTAAPSEKLDVVGNVQATSFIATTAGAGAYQYNSGTNMTVPDYVFEKHFKGESEINPEYTMNSLFEVEEYIEKYHHLPRVPSRDKLLKDGSMNIQGMQMITLEKVEELFIHSIEQMKENIALKDKLAIQEQKLSEQEQNFSTQLKLQKEAFSKEIDALKKLILEEKN